MGFGDGNKYISFAMDFDGGINNFGSPAIDGMLIYPPCAATCSAQGVSLATGNVSEILKGNRAYNTDNAYSIRDALSGGDTSDWERFGGSLVYNGNTWPGTNMQCVIIKVSSSKYLDVLYLSLSDH